MTDSAARIVETVEAWQLEPGDKVEIDSRVRTVKEMRFELNNNPMSVFHLEVSILFNDEWDWDTAGSIWNAKYQRVFKKLDRVDLFGEKLKEVEIARLNASLAACDRQLGEQLEANMRIHEHWDKDGAERDRLRTAIGEALDKLEDDAMDGYSFRNTDVRDEVEQLLRAALGEK